AAAGGQDSFSGDAGNDLIFGQGGNDTINGGSGNDTIDGGLGKDILTGGGGVDRFNISTSGDSSPVAGSSDQILGWDGTTYRLHFAPAATGAAAYSETTAADFGAALTAANTVLGGGTVDVVAVQIGSDVVVFADTNAGNSAGDAIVLVGKSLTDIS